MGHGDRLEADETPHLASPHAVPQRQRAGHRRPLPRWRRDTQQTDERVCQDTLEAVAVIPFPDLEAVWAPSESCGKKAAQ